MNRNQFDPKAAQSKSVFSELQLLRKRAVAAETRLQNLQGQLDAKTAGITLARYEAIRVTLRDLLVAVENTFLPTKDKKVHIPNAVKTAMEAAQKVVRPNVGSLPANDTTTKPALGACGICGPGLGHNSPVTDRVSLA